MAFLSGRILFDLVLLAGAAWGLWQAQLLPEGFGGGSIGPGDFPTAVLLLGVAALLEVLRQDVMAVKRGLTEQSAPAHLKGGIATVAVAALLVAYVVMLEPLGYLVATSGFLLCCILTCAYFLDPPQAREGWTRILVQAPVVAVLTTALSYVVFTYGFGLIFP